MLRAFDRICMEKERYKFLIIHYYYYYYYYYKFLNILILTEGHVLSRLRQKTMTAGRE